MPERSPLEQVIDEALPRLKPYSFIAFAPDTSKPIIFDPVKALNGRLGRAYYQEIDRYAWYPPSGFDIFVLATKKVHLQGINRGKILFICKYFGVFRGDQNYYFLEKTKIEGGFKETLGYMNEIPVLGTRTTRLLEKIARSKNNLSYSS